MYLGTSSAAGSCTLCRSQVSALLRARWPALFAGVGLATVGVHQFHFLLVVFSFSAFFVFYFGGGGRPRRHAYCTSQRNPEHQPKKKESQNPEGPFLDQFFALIPNLVSDSATDQVQYMNLRLKVELLCMGLDLTDSRIYGNSLCKVRSRTTIRATP